MCLCGNDDPIAQNNPQTLLWAFKVLSKNENVLFNTCVQVEFEPVHLSLLFLTVNVPKNFFHAPVEEKLTTKHH